MDSLLSNYASSDEDDDVINPPRHHLHPPSSSASFFTSLPPPKTSSSTSSLLSTIPPPKSQHLQNPSDSNPHLPPPVDSSTPLFNKLPQPNLKPILNLPEPKKKNIVQFMTPMVSGGRSSYDDEEEDDEEKERKKQREAESTNEAPTVKSFLSSIPAPKNSKAALGALPTSGSGRRSIIEADVPSLKQQKEQKIDEEASVAVVDSTLTVDNYQGAYVAGVDDSSWYQSGETYVDGGGSYGGEGYENYTGYGQYESNWIDRSGSNSMTETNDMPDIMSREMGKRRKTDMPTQIIEVKQDELMKNRPRDDQVKATGIAFGPSYQPVSSAKGKLSKLHKRKHQIGALYFDMKQKEPELAERRSRGFLTKAETHAKYGW